MTENKYNNSLGFLYNYTYLSISDKNILLGGELHNYTITNYIDEYSKKNTNINYIHYLHYVQHFIKKIQTQKEIIIDIYLENNKLYDIKQYLESYDNIINKDNYLTTTLNLFCILYYIGSIKYLFKDLNEKEKSIIKSFIYNEYVNTSNILDNVRIHNVDIRNILRDYINENLPEYKELYNLENTSIKDTDKHYYFYNENENKKFHKLLLDILKIYTKINHTVNDKYKLLINIFNKLSEKTQFQLILYMDIQFGNYDNFTKNVSRNINVQNLGSNFDKDYPISKNYKYYTYDNCQNTLPIGIIFTRFLDFYEICYFLYYLSPDYRKDEYKDKEPYSDYVFGIYGDNHRKYKTEIIEFLAKDDILKYKKIELNITDEDTLSSYEKIKNKLYNKDCKLNDIYDIFNNKMSKRLTTQEYLEHYGNQLYKNLYETNIKGGNDKYTDNTFGGLMEENEILLLKENHKNLKDEILYIYNLLYSDKSEIEIYDNKEKIYTVNYDNPILVYGGYVNIINVILIIIIIIILYFIIINYNKKCKYIILI